MDIRPAGAHDIAAIEALLAAAALPPLQRACFRAEDFCVARADGAIVGAIGLERYGDDALLRSLVVAPALRGGGVGMALVDALEKRAGALGLGALVLLTTTADRFFQRLGYAVIARDAMPPAAQQSDEFAHLCPASAVCMRKPLPRSIA